MYQLTSRKFLFGLIEWRTEKRWTDPTEETTVLKVMVDSTEAHKEIDALQAKADNLAAALRKLEDLREFSEAGNLAAAQLRKLNARRKP